MKVRQVTRRLVDNAILGIYRSTPDGTFLEINPALASIFGYESPGEMKTSIRDIRSEVFVSPADFDTIRQKIEEDGQVRNYLAEFYQKAGHRIWLSLNVVPVYDREHRVLYHEGTVEDVTGRKLAEDELKKKTHDLSLSYEQLSLIEEELRQNYDELRKQETQTEKRAGSSSCNH